MKHLILLLTFVLAPALSDAADDVLRVTMNDRHRVLLQLHCQKCHGADTAEAKIRMDELPLTTTRVEMAERWRKTLHALNSKEIPPEDEAQLDKVTKTDRLHVYKHKGRPERVNLYEGHVFKEITS